MQRQACYPAGKAPRSSNSTATRAETRTPGRRNVRVLKRKMAGIAPGHFHFGVLASARRRDAGGRGRQRRRSAVEQGRDAADGDAPVDAARPWGLFFQILRTV